MGGKVRSSVLAGDGFEGTLGFGFGAAVGVGADVGFCVGDSAGTGGFELGPLASALLARKLPPGCCYCYYY